MVSRFLTPMFLALPHTQISPLAPFSLDLKHSLMGHLSIIFLSEEASVFYSRNKFRTWDNWSGSWSLSVNVETHPLENAIPALENTSGLSSPTSLLQRIWSQFYFIADFSEKWTGQEKLPSESSRPDLVLCLPNPNLLLFAQLGWTKFYPLEMTSISDSHWP